MNKAELIEIGQQYFAKPTVTVMYCTPDGNFFYDLNFASSHARSNKMEVVTLTRADYGPSSTATNDSKLGASKEVSGEESISLEEQYKEETGKNAIWKGSETKAFAEWKKDK